ncbi:MAG: acyltransferase family protein [Actinomycetaceae bacterium]|nr:acyltransferase family protein [Actinomycetaceae bacterium]
MVGIARSIAIISITLNHAVNRSFSVYHGQHNEFVELPLWVSVTEATVATFSRLGVPLFLMITGALMLHRDYESKGRISRFLKYNWLQLLITTEIWLTIMFWYIQLLPKSVLRTDGIGECLKDFFCTLLFIDPVTMGNMWYMSMILCVYLMIPILAIGLKRIDVRFLLYRWLS